jgi:hypothetical protein
MKKLLLLLLIAPIIGNSQMLNLPISKAIAVQGFQHTTPETSAIVPVGKLWQFVGATQGNYIKSYSNAANTANPGHWYVGQGDQNNFIDLTNHHSIYGNVVFGEGTMIRYEDNGENYINTLFFIEYDLDAQNLAYNVPNQTTPVLFPNPTSSLLALNSDKEYDIEVYDMAGNKVMALTGNTINMSHLSSATYIVKALDKVENEEVSYKVVKN